MSMTEQLAPDVGAIALLPEKALVPAEVFKSAGDVDAVLDEVARRARRHVADLSTATSRKHIASVAFDVSKSKVVLEKMAVALVAEKKAEVTAVDKERIRLGKVLDALRDEVRAPLTEWEEAEKAKAAALAKRVQDIRDIALMHDGTVTGIQMALDMVTALDVEDGYGDQAGAAALAQTLTAKALRGALQAAQEREAAEAARIAEEARQQAQREAEAAELAAQVERDRQAALARAAEEQAERERVAEERRIQREAEHAAQIERLKEEAAQAEKDRRAREADAEDRRKRQAEADKLAAEAEAERRAEQAAENERRRIKAQQDAIAADALRRQQDREHKGRIMGEVKAALMALGLEEEQAKAVVLNIAAGKVVHTVMEF